MRKEHKRLLLSIAVGVLYIWAQPKRVTSTGNEMLHFLRNVSAEKHCEEGDWLWKTTVHKTYTEGELWYQNQCYYRIVYLEKSRTLHDEPFYRERISSEYWNAIDNKLNQLFIHALLRQKSEDKQIRLLREQLGQVKKRAWLK